MNAEHQSYAIKSNGLLRNLVKTRIVMIETNSEDLTSKLEQHLDETRFEFVDIVKQSSGILARIQRAQPDVMLLSCDVLGKDLLNEISTVNRCFPLPVVVFARKHAPDVLTSAIEAGVSSYVVDDLQAHRVPVIIDLAIARFAQVRSLSNELKQTKEKLSERKLIERAKGILMQQKRLTEKEAYAQLRKSAMDQGQSMAKLSKRIINVFEMLAE